MKEIWTALVTPFLRNQQINYSDLSRLIDIQVNSNVCGLVVLGSTGEYHSLTENERHDLIDFIFKKVAGRCKIMIGVSAVSVETTCAAIEQAKLISEVQGEQLEKKDDQVTIADLLSWWDTFFEVETVDPFRAAVAAMEQTNVISPSSDFRGHWDLIQAILLFYIALMLPYRIGFDHDVALWSVWFWMDLLIDVYFVRTQPQLPTRR